MIFTGSYFENLAIKWKNSPADNEILIFGACGGFLSLFEAHSNYL